MNTCEELKNKSFYLDSIKHFLFNKKVRKNIKMKLKKISLAKSISVLKTIILYITFFIPILHKHMNLFDLREIAKFTSTQY